MPRRAGLRGETPLLWQKALKLAAALLAPGGVCLQYDTAKFGNFADVQAMAPEKVEAMQRNLLAVRHMFLWHTDPARPSAVDYVIHDLCAWAKAP